MTGKTVLPVSLLVASLDNRAVAIVEAPLSIQHRALSVTSSSDERVTIAATCAGSLSEAISRLGTRLFRLPVPVITAFLESVVRALMDTDCRALLVDTSDKWMTISTSSHAVLRKAISSLGTRLLGCEVSVFTAFLKVVLVAAMLSAGRALRGSVEEKRMTRSASGLREAVGG